MINDTLPTMCDPCLANPFHLYKTLLLLPAFLAIPVQSLVLLTQASLTLTEKTDILTLGIVFVDCLISISIIISAFTLKFLPALYSYAWSSVVSLLCFGHPLFQSLVCIERYLAVEHPVVFMKYRPLRYRFVVLAVALVITLFGDATVMILCALYKSLKVVFLKLECTFLAIIVTVNSFACLSILRTLLQPSPGDKKLKSQNSSSRQSGTFVKRRAFCIILLVQINMLICYLPPILFFLSRDELICSVYLYNVWYIELMSSLHCLVYLQHMNQLKNIYNAFVRVFNIKR